MGLPEDMLSIAYCESRYLPTAHRTDNPGQQRTGDFGLFQINWKWVDEWGLPKSIATSTTDLFDPVRNAQAAKFIYDIYGYSAWVCKR